MENNVNVNISEINFVKCEDESCESKYFEMIHMMKKIPPILSPTGKELTIKLEALRCVDCGKIVDEITEDK